MRSVFILAALAFAASVPLVADDPSGDAAFSAAQVAFFENDVLPIIQQHCFPCHGGKAEISGEFRITSRAGVLKGGELGPAVDLENRESSELLSAINYESVEMPPSGKLPREQIEVLTKWVQMGLPWSQREDYGVAAQGAVDTRGDGRNYWAYQPIIRPPLPATENKSWISNPIDAFVLAKLEAADLRPNSPADKVSLVRRAYLRIGL